jgi:peptidoglycan/LPS O-acetylase OafA/YrhL
VAVVRGHRPDLDGIRAIGMLQVMAYHFEAGPLFKGAAINVDLFFALSGYLITGLLIAERADTGRVDLLAFYLRRALRLLPALLILLSFGGIAIAVALPGDRNHALVVGGLMSLFYVTDLVSYSHDTLWATYVWTWTLSMEEQFYLLWPTILRRGALTRKRGRQLVFLATVAALVLAELTAKGAGPHANAPIDYYQPQAHVFSILIGCCAALVEVPRWFRHLALPALAGLIALGQFSPLHMSASYLRFNVPAAAVLTVVVMLALEHSPRAAGVILGNRPIAHLGAISYGLYLYHPVVYIVLAQQVHRAHWLIVVLSFLVTWIIAEITYRYWESPIRRRGRAWLARRKAPRGAVSA